MARGMRCGAIVGELSPKEYDALQYIGINSWSQSKSAGIASEGVSLDLSKIDFHCQIFTGSGVYYNAISSEIDCSKYKKAILSCSFTKSGSGYQYTSTSCKILLNNTAIATISSNTTDCEVDLSNIDSIKVGFYASTTGASGENPIVHVYLTKLILK